MNETPRHAIDWAYQGIWGILTQWLNIPETPPTLPSRAGHEPIAFRPAPGYLRYRGVQYGIGLLAGMGIPAFVFVILLVAVLASGAPWPVIGLVLLAGFVGLCIIMFAAVTSYLAYHLSYDLTWYVLSNRSLRIRKGIWQIREETITFENVQNVSVSQGPLQRHFGIADVLVETAGGGGARQQAGQNQQTGPKRGAIEGVGNAEEIRDLILQRVRKSQSSGLGDDAKTSSHQKPLRTAPRFQPEHLAILREIRDAAAHLAQRATDAEEA